MREIIAVCRSEKQSRDRVAKVLDRYFWRIGDRTWRGKATNACLDRVSRELRKRATRNTAVVIHEIRTSAESRRPIIRIGSQRAFSETGVVPVATRPTDVKHGTMRHKHARSGSAIIGIAALFHDLGKATNLFQNKLRRALEGGTPEADAVRHELFSAAIWDVLFGQIPDNKIAEALMSLKVGDIDRSSENICRRLNEIHAAPENGINFSFINRPDSLSYLIGMLILTHHRLPSADNSHIEILGDRHVNTQSMLDCSYDLAIAQGTPFWHETWFFDALAREARLLTPEIQRTSGDIALRGALMFADHLGSANKTPSHNLPDHLANTTKDPDNSKILPGDSLSQHVYRVYRYTRFSYEMIYSLRDRYPAIDEPALPSAIAFPEPSPSPRFSWQYQAANTAREICGAREGGFFAAIIAGTGTGKTRGAPTILANAAMADCIPERRYLRMNLGLGLRVLATQSAKEYVSDLKFSNQDVAVLVGDPPLDFEKSNSQPENAAQGSESLIHLPEWLRVELASGKVPNEGDADEETWLKGLSVNTDRGLPAFLDRILEKSGPNAPKGRLLLQTPIMVGTIDHLMAVAAPVNSRFLLQSLRVITSDLILDEIDQYDGEDLAAIARLVFQTGAAGRRVIIMSATLTTDIAETLHLAYRRGWSNYACENSRADHVNTLVCGDTPGAIFTNQEGETISGLVVECQRETVKSIRAATPLRRAEILPVCEDWSTLVAQIDQGCSRLHDANTVDLDGFHVSVGMVRMTRIAHTTALAMQMQSGIFENRLRVMICLHANMPRLHRGYIETRLKDVLTRKGQHPETNLYRLCQNENLFDKAQQAGVRDIEIVVVTTPVIETGNDVDFDWAILDPISTRSIIQSAGRVRRHRPARGGEPNIYILGQSPIAMQTGTLSRPGVETKPHGDTRVSFDMPLENFKGRYFKDIAGDADFRTVTVAPLFSDTISFPLRDAETNARAKMISTYERDPLGRYLACPNARWNLMITRTRKFRRSNTQDIEFVKTGETLDEAKWYLDLAPGTRESVKREATGLQIFTPRTSTLFPNLTEMAWQLLAGTDVQMNAADMRTLLKVSIPQFGDDMDFIMTYSDFTGFTRGTPEDLFEPFGKPK